MFPSVKTKAIKTLSGVLLLVILLQCFPGFALGYDLDVHARIRNFVSAQVENSNNIIGPNRLKIKPVSIKTAWIGNKYRGGFYTLKTKQG